jgi:hypothetical protein
VPFSIVRVSSGELSALCCNAATVPLLRSTIGVAQCDRSSVRAPQQVRSRDQPPPGRLIGTHFQQRSLFAHARE